MAAAFYLNVAVLGCEGSGKSSVVNALASGLVAEIGRQEGKRTTESIDAFELGNSDESSQKNSSSASDHVDPDPIKAIYNQVKLKNESLRSNDDEKKGDEDAVSNHYYMVPARKHPIAMWHGCRLTLMDTPSMDARVRSYCRQQWGSLDATIVVLDATKPVEDTQQIELLKFVQMTRDKMGRVPCFILWNKIKDAVQLTKEEQQMFQETHKLIETVFGKSPDQQLEHSTPNNNNYPVLVPTSTTSALLFDAGSGMSKEEFTKQVPLNWFDEIGRQECGADEWGPFSVEQKFDKMHALLQHNQTDNNDSTGGDNSADSFRGRLCRGSGFDKLVLAMEQRIGGHIQPAIAERALEHMMKNNDANPSHFLNHLEVFMEMHKALGKSTHQLRERCWEGYDKMAKAASDTFSTDYGEGLKDLVHVAYQLQSLQCLCSDEGHQEGMDKEWAKLIMGFLATINHHANTWDIKRWFSVEEKERRTSTTWRTLSPIDWHNLLESVLLLRCEPMFARCFGPEILVLEQHKSQLQGHLSRCSKGGRKNCSFGDHKSIHEVCKVELAATPGGRAIPLNKSHDRFVSLEIPRDFATAQNHFGHIIYLFCRSKDNHAARPLPSFWTTPVVEESSVVPVATVASKNANESAEPTTNLSSKKADESCGVTDPTFHSSVATNEADSSRPKKKGRATNDGAASSQPKKNVPTTVRSSAKSEADASQPKKKRRATSAGQAQSPPALRTSKRQRRTPQRIQLP
ncbi:expressed unknown protein [Seminavis robusta]|uniref:Dynamin N-terminal domain-containing protein n=1 Tax=Seminavis robusta TaxID=568900 RepID=A0A9N8HB82_9STRA|nr:expressed unknown protein [Seminavis robusta]|eukprot:Sro268_g103640.1 n/a (743) ;mRNA; r:20225-22548